MFKSKKTFDISVDTSKSTSNHCNTNTIREKKGLKRLCISAIIGIISVSTLSSSIAWANNSSAKELDTPNLTREVINRSVPILSTDSFKDSFSILMEEEKRVAEEKAFLESVEKFPEEYSNLKDLKQAIINLSKDFGISEETLDIALEKADALAIPSITPVTGLVTSKFGYRSNPYSKGKSFHYGMDIQNAFDSDIYATAHGTVVFAEYYKGYGNFVQIDHGNGIITCYGHLNTFKCNVGDVVSAGTPIGTMGKTGQATGVHLHYEVRVDGEKVDPLEYISDLSEMTFL